ncbi:hypothetical protein RBU60_12475 [Mesonia sp. MT50]|uniref:Riboflavin synthase subunit beta n=1 Tax=Mesonia profundi TaxID=3070998 RepID=A0ABU1A448_9FLAO|nr:hypothetical protein [Mesonia profundi]MDQ7918389.1 hypothetical protein [Mesonia profundi]
MSWGAGHVFDMINRIKQNRALRGSRKNKFKENSRYLHKTSLKPNPFLKTYPEKKVNQIKCRIRTKANRRNKKQAFVFWTFLAFGFLFIVLILFYL